MRQAGYSSDLLLIISLGVSKISILILLLQISPITLHRRLAAMLGGFIVIWSLSSLLASAFQCDLPSAWMIVEGRCFDQVRYSTLQSQLTLFILRQVTKSVIDLILDSIWCCQYTDRSCACRTTHIRYMESPHSHETEICCY